MITGVDHMFLQVRDLDATVANYEAIFGRTCNWRGGMGDVKHAWFQFGNFALDIVAPANHGSGLIADIEKYGEGLQGLGFTVPNLDEAKHLFSRRGIAFASEHTTKSQNAESKTRTWRVAMLRRKSAGGVAQFLVENVGEKWPEMPVASDAPVTNLDHVVAQTPNPERALVHYGARLGLDLRLDRSNEQWGARQLFFRCGNAVVEIGASLKTPVSDARDTFGGLAWRVKDPEAARARIAAAGLDVSQVRKGRKPGTAVFTVRSGTGNVPTLMLSGND